MNAALWTLLAEVSQSPQAQKVCMILEEVPTDALTAFVADFCTVQREGRLIMELPELERIKVSRLKGGGPGVILEITDSTTTTTTTPKQVDQESCTAALKSFVERIVVGLEACPYTKSANWSATGLEKRGVTPGPVAYRCQASDNVCDALSAFWTCVCELQATPEEQISTTLLSLPNIAPGTTSADLDRFAAVVELVSRSLCHFGGDQLVGLVHFHPAYQRTQIAPVHQPAFGHLPPQSWLRSILRYNGNLAAAESLTDADLSLSDYQRRAPHTMINILRVSQLNAAVGAKSIVDLPLGNGVVVKASGISLYSRNVIKLAEQGKDKLQRELEIEIEWSQKGYGTSVVS